MTFLTVLLFVFLHAGAQKLSEVKDTVEEKKAEAREDNLVLDTVIGTDEEYEDEPYVFDEPDYFDVKYPWDSYTDSLKLRNLPDTVISNLKKDKNFWYADYEFEKQKQKKQEVKAAAPLRDRAWFKTLMWVIIIGVFAYAVISYLHGSNAGLFRKNSGTFSDRQQEAEETENIFEINYQQRIDRAIQEGNYRLATRLRFLQMLKAMAGKNIIQYKQERTNFDYLMQLRSSTYYNDFFRLTRNYEYAWYGNFPVTEEAWQVIKNDFEKFDKGLLRK